MKDKHLVILGIRGIPASHGGFETFAEYLALYLVEKGWRVTVYCQIDGKGGIGRDIWSGVDLIKIPVSIGGAKGTVIFDLLSILHSLRYRTVHLTLGYNTAFFNIFQRIMCIKNIINMDGIEWKRKKWGRAARLWFWLNERIGSIIGNHLIADHPEIKRHLARNVKASKITMIPYGAPDIQVTHKEHLKDLGVEPNKYLLVIARPEPENSILEIVKAFSEVETDLKLLILGNYDSSNNYQKKVLEYANESTILPGAIYDKEVVSALRYYARFYIHGHQVGGTNPSLVEALGAKNAVIAHDNKYNKWVCGDETLFFSDSSSLQKVFEFALTDDYLGSVEYMKKSSYEQYKKRFTWNSILESYENLLEAFL